MDYANYESISKEQQKGPVCDLNNLRHSKPQTFIPDENFMFSYSIIWKEDPQLSWENRLDAYQQAGVANYNLDWIQLLASFTLLIFLSAFVSQALRSILIKDTRAISY